jgi:hypothetical protein
MNIVLPSCTSRLMTAEVSLLYIDMDIFTKGKPSMPSLPIYNLRCLPIRMCFDPLTTVHWIIVHFMQFYCILHIVGTAMIVF